jgi:hypothetical protein
MHHELVHGREVGIWWVQKRFPWYGVHIWSLCPNIRFLPSIVAEKNVHICSMCIWTQASYMYPIPWGAFLDHQIPTSCLPTLLIFMHIEHICTTGSRNLMGPKTLPTIWGTYMKLVTKYQISAINSCWEKCDEKWAHIGIPYCG